MRISGRTVGRKTAALVAAAAIGASAIGGLAASAATLAPGAPVAALAEAAHQTIAQILAPLVSKGVITQAQADAVAQAIAAARPERAGRTPFAGPAAGRPFGPGFGMGASGEVTTYLGVPADEVRTQRQTGKSLGEIADATAGKSRAGLIAALTAAENARIDQAATSGRITADQATAAKAKVAAGVTKLVDDKGRGDPRGMRPGGGPFGGRGAAPSASPKAN